MNLDLNDRVIFVAGASRGIGKAIALLGGELRVVEDRAKLLSAWRCRVCGASGHDASIQPPGVTTAGGAHSMSR